MLAILVHGRVRSVADAEEAWKKHVVQEGLHNTTVVAADYTGDGEGLDVMFNAAGKRRGCGGPRLAGNDRRLARVHDHGADPQRGAFECRPGR